MGTITWMGPLGSDIDPTSGRYGLAANWNTGAIPGRADDAVLSPGAYVVDHTTATAAVHGLTVGAGAALKTTTAFQTLDRTAVDGRLVLVDAVFSSSFLFGAGTVSGTGTVSSFIGAPRTFAGIVPTGLGFNAVGGTLTINALSPFQSQFGGRLSGSGTIDFHAGAVVFNAGTRASVANLTVSGAAILLKTEFSYGGNFTLSGGTLGRSGFATGGTRAVFTGTATLAGGAIFQSDTVLFKGDTTIAAGTSTTMSRATVVNGGTITALGDIALGTPANYTGTFVNRAGAVYDFVRDSSINADFGPNPGPGFTASFVNAGTVVKNGGTGTSQINALLTNNGGIQVSTGTLLIADAVRGSGAFAIDNDATLYFNDAVARTQTVFFGTGGDGTLSIDDRFAGTVAGFAAGDTLDVRDVFAGHVSYKANAANTGGTLTVANGSTSAEIGLAGQYLASAFHAGSDGKHGTLVTYDRATTTPIATLAVAQA